MSNYDYWFKTDDTRPTVRVEFSEIEPNDEQDKEQTRVTSATFSMKNVSTDEVVIDEQDATLRDGDEDDGLFEGEVEYQLDATETESAGMYVAEFTLNYKDGSVRTIPAGHNIAIKVSRGI